MSEQRPLRASVVHAPSSGGQAESEATTGTKAARHYSETDCELRKRTASLALANESGRRAVAALAGCDSQATMSQGMHTHSLRCTRSVPRRRARAPSRPMREPPSAPHLSEAEGSTRLSQAATRASDEPHAPQHAAHEARRQHMHIDPDCGAMCRPSSGRRGLACGDLWRRDTAIDAREAALECAQRYDRVAVGVGQGRVAANTAGRGNPRAGKRRAHRAWSTRGRRTRLRQEAGA